MSRNIQVLKEFKKNWRVNEEKEKGWPERNKSTNVVRGQGLRVTETGRERETSQLLCDDLVRQPSEIGSKWESHPRVCVGEINKINMNTNNNNQIYVLCNCIHPLNYLYIYLHFPSFIKKKSVFSSCYINRDLSWLPKRQS